MDKHIKSEVLKNLGTKLLERGFSTRVITEQGIETLRLAFVLNEKADSPMGIDIAFYNFDATAILQFYGYVNPGVDAAGFDAVKKAVNEANQISPMGHYGYDEEDRQVFYRYCELFTEEEDVERMTEKSLAVLNIIFNVLNVNRDRF